MRSPAANRARMLLRQSESALVIVAVLVGGLAGLLVSLVGSLAGLLHHLLFSIPIGHHLSSLASVTPLQLLVPAAGGLLLGLTGLLILRWRTGRPVDPIEANALLGGRMSLTDSLLITAQTIVSNGFGASVGLEAAYTQMGSGAGSRLGELVALRRNDLRTMVGCGAAGAIAAAFGAPLTGAFYAFELIIGTYSMIVLAPVVAASISGMLVTRLLSGEAGFMGQVSSTSVFSAEHVLAAILLSTVCAFAGIAIMRGVVLVEAGFKRSHLPAWLQPAVGGLILGGLAFVSPKVFSSGHGALFTLLGDPTLTTEALALLFILKALASAVSIGSGFRGGLFFASLFLGALLGKIFAQLAVMVDPTLAPDAAVFAIVGMTGLAVAVVGGPLTMSFLALETTGDLPLAMLVLAAAAAVSVVVRRSFGYSFATWRLHLRGEAIRSAHDVGWIRDLTVRRLMRADVRTIAADATLAQFRKEFPLGSTQRVVAVDADGRYRGIVPVAEAHLADLDDGAERTTIEGLAAHADAFLLPGMNAKVAQHLFERSTSEALAVVDSQAQRHVIGLVTEAHLLRRYTEELERVRRDLSGDRWTRA